MESKVYFVSGIDTDCGKTYFTARLAAYWHQKGVAVITQKPIQTGCTGMADDLLEHRRIMGTDLLPEDLDGTTCSYLFNMPASPHLAAEVEGKTIDLARITFHTHQLQQKYERVIIEGAGGLMVPITRQLFTIDYIKDNNYPLILVASSKLGSINHTLLSIESCLSRHINLHTLVYNRFEGHNPVMADDSFRVIADYLREHSPKTKLIDFRGADDFEGWEE